MQTFYHFFCYILTLIQSNCGFVIHTLSIKNEVVYKISWNSHDYELKVLLRNYLVFHACMAEERYMF